MPYWRYRSLQETVIKDFILPVFEPCCPHLSHPDSEHTARDITLHLTLTLRRLTRLSRFTSVESSSVTCKTELVNTVFCFYCLPKGRHSKGPHEIRLICAQNNSSRQCFLEPLDRFSGSKPLLSPILLVDGLPLLGLLHLFVCCCYFFFLFFFLP